MESNYQKDFHQSMHEIRQTIISVTQLKNNIFMQKEDNLHSSLKYILHLFGSIQAMLKEFNNHAKSSEEKSAIKTTFSLIEDETNKITKFIKTVN